jgi:hypothetical protein
MKAQNSMTAQEFQELVRLNGGQTDTRKWKQFAVKHSPEVQAQIASLDALLGEMEDDVKAMQLVVNRAARLSAFERIFGFNWAKRKRRR